MPDVFTRPTDNDDPFGAGVEINVATADHVLSQPCRGFYVAGAGIVEITTVGGSTLTLDCGANSYHPWRVTTFHNPETTATGIVAGW